MENIKSFNELLALIEENKKYKILLHSCCGPCSSACIELLKSGLNVDIYYYNPNIDTEEEYNKRSAEQIRISNILSPDSSVLIGKYQQSEFSNAINGLEMLGEKSIRCYNCYKFRMRKTAETAKELGYDYWTTTLSISPHKNSNWINEIGFELADEIGIPFIYSNFKLKDGYKRSIELSKQYEMYRQNYCGCKYSKIERGVSLE